MRGFFGQKILRVSPGYIKNLIYSSDVYTTKFPAELEVKTPGLSSSHFIHDYIWVLLYDDTNWQLKSARSPAPRGRAISAQSEFSLLFLYFQLFIRLLLLLLLFLFLCSTYLILSLSLPNGKVCALFLASQVLQRAPAELATRIVIPR